MTVRRHQGDQCCNRRVLEQVARSDRYTSAPGTGHKLYAENRITPEFEEIVVDTNVLDA